MTSKKYPSGSDSGEPFLKDDLQLINGIGPAIVKKLHGVGINTFAQLAALSPADIAAAIADSAERIIKQDWIGQAHKLAANKAQPGVETPLIEEPDQPSGTSTENKSLTPPKTKPRVAAILRVRDLEMIRGESASLARILTRDETFDIRLTLDFTGLHEPEHVPLNYKALIYGKARGNPGIVIGEAQGTIMPSDGATITVIGNTLPEGTYRLAAKVIVGLPTMKLTAGSDNTGIIDGGLVQVY
ncbi:MAG: helix-hairpin-helix domain-containing protein [Ktedonobacteraceae bacterium]